MRPFTKLLLLTLCLALSLFYAFSTGYVSHIFFLLALSLVALCSGSSPNIRFVATAYLIISIFETGLFGFTMRLFLEGMLPVFANTALLMGMLLIDITLYNVVKHRKTIQLKMLNDANPMKTSSIISYSNIDAPLMGIAASFCIIDIIVMLENFIRNLEHFGVPESFAKQFWHWDWIYYASQPIKLCLQALTIMVLFAGIYITRSRAARGEKPLSYDDCSTSN